ncbi:MAG: hypothetical protein M1837_003603 [Sclerophora amabilis]|nr:MAG: hypothetical protein M1837_003603 [Sclerophora amabilis]
MFEVFEVFRVFRVFRAFRAFQNNPSRVDEPDQFAGYVISSRGPAYLLKENADVCWQPPLNDSFDVWVVDFHAHGVCRDNHSNGKIQLDKFARDKVLVVFGQFGMVGLKARLGLLDRTAQSNQLTPKYSNKHFQLCNSFDVHDSLDHVGREDVGLIDGGSNDLRISESCRTLHLFERLSCQGRGGTEPKDLTTHSTAKSGQSRILPTPVQTLLLHHMQFVYCYKDQSILEGGNLKDICSKSLLQGDFRTGQYVGEVAFCDLVTQRLTISIAVQHAARGGQKALHGT